MSIDVALGSEENQRYHWCVNVLLKNDERFYMNV